MTEIDPYDFNLNGEPLPDNSKDQLIEFASLAYGLILDLKIAREGSNTKELSHVVDELITIVPDD